MGARHKHGIITSREVKGAQIVENISAFNAGTGIMLDRKSNESVVGDNVVFANDADGIAIFESDKAAVTGNLVFANARDGVLVRNSSGVQVSGNTVDRNGNYGVQFLARELDASTRDVELDPYTARSEGRAEGNGLHRNLDAAMSAKGGVELLIRGNDFSRSAPQVFSDDLKDLAPLILEQNDAGGYRFQGNPDGGQP
jgi:nitrous oxidase accessory protein NosD